MTDAKKQDFMLRITGANRTGLVVVLYDMFLEYMEELKAAIPGSGEFKKAVDCGRNVLLELMDSLNMKTEIGKNTYSLYRFADRRLIMASIRQNTERVDEAVSIMQRLRDAYAKSVENDDSPALMQNAEVAYAGMTYGPGELNTDYTGAGANRGYLA